MGYLPCWCVLRVHPCIVVEKKVNIIYLLLPGVIMEYTHLVTNHLNTLHGKKMYLESTAYFFCLLQ